MRYLIFILFSCNLFGQVATGSNATIYQGTTSVTAASRGVVYDNLSFDNAPVVLAILRDIDAGVYDRVVFESGRRVNFETTLIIPYNSSNNSMNSIGNGRLTTDGTDRVTFYTDNNICQVLTTVPGTGFQNFTFQNIKFEHGGSTLTGCGPNNNDASLFTLTHSDDGGTYNVYFDNCEFTAPNVYMDGASGFSQTNNGITDVTFKDCYFHNTGRMLFEFFGQRFPNLLTYNPATQAYIKRLTIDGGIYEDGGLINELGISIVQGVYDVVIENITVRDCVAMIELGITYAYVDNIIAEGVGDVFWFGGIYDDYDFPLFIQGDYVINNIDVDVTGGVDMFGGMRDIIFQNSTLRTGQSWWGRNTYGTMEVNNSTLILGYNTNASMRQELDRATWLFQNTEIEKLSNNALFQDRSVVNLNCVNILLDGSETFLSSGYQSIADTSTFVNGVFAQEFGNTGTDCGVIGYVATGTVTPPSTSGSAIRQKIMRQFFNW